VAEERVRRRLAAILAADVVGYSRLIEADEAGTRARLRSLQSELIGPRIEADGGRIVKTTGDGLLVEFPSAVDAVRNALAIQTAMAERSAGIPENRRITFRVGINVGDVIVEGDDIHGDGVNVAARLEGLCAPGEVYVSATVHDHVTGKIDASFEDLGEHEVKNIARKVRVYRAQADTGRAAIEIGSATPLAPPEKPSIAVLPFANMSGDPEQEYFADGITEDLITALSHNRWFFVIARNSTFAYKNQSPDVRTVARELGVEYVLEGSVRKSSGQVRITAQLIDAATGKHVWAERYDRKLEDVFAIQDEITETIAGAIEPELGRVEQARAKSKRPDNLHAWDLYQRGMWHLYQRSKDDLAEALRLFEAAIEEAPTLAVAFAGAEEACFYQITGNYFGVSHSLRTKMIDFGRRAVELDDLDAFTHLALGRALNLQGDHDGAISELETAIRLNPSYAWAHYSLGWTLNWAGRPAEAIPNVEKAMRLSPRDPAIGQYLLRMSESLLFMRRPEEAVAWAQKSVQQPGIQPSRLVLLAAALAYANKIDEARQTVARLQRLSPTFRVTTAADIFRLRDQATKQYLLDGLRKAGLPE